MYETHSKGSVFRLPTLHCSHARSPSVPDAALELLERHDAHGTFFVVGRVAQALPGLVRSIRVEEFSGLEPGGILVVRFE